MTPTERAVLDAIAKERIGWQWHGSTLRLTWWLNDQEHRRFTPAERRAVHRLLANRMAWRHPAIGYSGRGMVALTGRGAEALSTAAHQEAHQ